MTEEQHGGLGWSLAGRIVVVTGAGRGLGATFARALGAAGASVVVAEIDQDRGRAVEAELRSAGSDATFVACDVADPASVDGLAAQVREIGPLYGLVNNAALADGVGGKTFWELTVEEWDRIQAVNVRGLWLVSRALAPQMIEAGDGRIVNLASAAALHGSDRLGHYVASKGAVIALTRAMARDIGPAGVTVNALAPGLVVGESSERIPASRHDLWNQNRSVTRPQQPDDLVAALLYLLSAGSAYTTGQTLVVDGGMVMP